MTDIDKIKWREVTESEYGQTHYSCYRRATRLGLDVVRYEIGTSPTELPTKPGAVVAPGQGDIGYGYVPYVLGPDGTWYELQRDSQDAFPSDQEVIINYIDEGRFYIAYGGYDE